MSLTHPPIREVEIWPRSQIGYDIRAQAVENACGVRLGGLFDATIASNSWTERTPCTYISAQMIGGGDWVLMPRTVDEVTGWQMVELLDMDHSDFLQTLAQWEADDEATYKTV